MEERKMKKIYKTPSICTVNVRSEESFMTASKPGAASGTIFDGTEGEGGMGEGGAHGDAKRNVGGFWDDEE